METTIISHVTKGLIITLLLIILDVVGYYTGIKFLSSYNYLLWGVLLLLFIVAATLYARQAGGSFGAVFSHAFKTAAVVTCLFFVYQLLAVNFFFPDIKQRLIEAAAKENNKPMSNFTEDDLALMRKIVSVSQSAGSILKVLVSGLIGAVVGGTFAKKK
ncbi:MAG: hypothetical protein RLZZ316_2579 [Bacteroidota bacterium]|jgi:Protein of unknown function (DUF4199)